MLNATVRASVSDPRFGAESRIDFASTLKAWSVAREVVGALRAGMGWTPERADGWSEEYRASTPSGDFDEGESLEELREVWRQNHLDLQQLWATFVADGIDVPADRVFMALVTDRDGSWTAFLEFEGAHGIALRTFAIDLVAGIRRSIEPSFPGLQASLSEPAVQSSPQRVRGPRAPKTKEDILAEVFGTPKPKVDLVSEVRTILERPAGSGAVDHSQTFTHAAPEPEADTPVATPDPVEARPEAAPVARRGRILRSLGATTEKVVIGAVAAAITAIVGASTVPWWWPFR